MDIEEVRAELVRQIGSGADTDTEEMKLCCVHLFNHGSLEDVLLIWRAKESGWDAHFSIDVQLLCGAGLAETKTYLAGETSAEAVAALEYITRCEAAKDFEGFVVADRSAWYREYFGLSQ